MLEEPEIINSLKKKIIITIILNHVFFLIVYFAKIKREITFTTHNYTQSIQLFDFQDHITQAYLIGPNLQTLQENEMEFNNQD